MKNDWQDRYRDYKQDDNTYYDKDHGKDNSAPSARPQSHPDHSNMDSLKGKTVTIYRGGPESKSGKLLDRQLDYLTLYTPNKEVIYYQTEHVKSIGEDSKLSSTQHGLGDEEKVEYVKSQNFKELLRELENEAIQLNQGGPERLKGLLLSVRKDFLILSTEADGIVYVKLHHIKSVSKSSHPAGKEGEEETVKHMDLIKAAYFSDVFKHLQQQWVAVNRGGPEAMEGVLVEKTGEYYTLVCHHTILRIHPFHVRSISLGSKGSMKQNKGTNEEDSKTETNKDENKGKDTDGNKDESKDKGKDENKDGNKDKGKDGNKDESKDKGKDGNKDESKDKGKDENKDGNKDKGKDGNKDESKDKGKDGNKDESKDKGKDGNKDESKDKGKDGNKDESKDKGKDENKDGSKDKGEDGNKDEKKDKGKGKDKEGNKDRGKKRNKDKDKK